MSNVSIGSDLSSDTLSVLMQAAFQGFTGASERLEKAYATLREQVTALNLELNDTNLRLTQSLHENAKIRHYLSNLLTSIEQGIVVVDAIGQITLWSGGAERLTGFTAAEALGGQADRLLGEDAAVLLHGLTGDGHDGPREGRIIRKDGYILEVEIAASPIRDEGGKVLDTLLVFDDISQRKWVEERRRRSTAQAGLEEMAVTIAHGIRNPLASIELLATILAEEAEADVRKSQLAHGIQAGVASVNTILTNLLVFTRSVTPCLRPLELHGVVEEALSTALYALKERQIDLIRLYNGGPLDVDGDRELLKQVFLNLILNAVQAMPSGGKLRINTRGPVGGFPVLVGGHTTADSQPAGWRRETGAMAGGEFVEVKVSDSGCGIGEENLEKVFLPFFTTKPKGAGLGLAIIERILERHGARVSLESRVGDGTTFTILFRSRRQTRASSQGGI